MAPPASLPACLRPSKVTTEWRGQLRYDGDALLTQRFHDGALTLRPGVQIGSVQLRERAGSPPFVAKILMVGALRLGDRHHAIGVTRGWDGIWLATPRQHKNPARLWSAPGFKMREAWGYEGSARAWDVTLAEPIRLLLEGVAYLYDRETGGAAGAWLRLANEYRSHVRAGVENALLSLERAGISRSADDIAIAVRPDWTRDDLYAFPLSPAELVAVALALTGPAVLTQPPELQARAEGMLATGLLASEGLPLVGLDGLRALLRDATARLGASIPAWADAGIFTDWRHLHANVLAGDTPPSFLPRWQELGERRAVARHPSTEASPSGYVLVGAPTPILTLRRRHDPQTTSAADDRRPPRS